MGGTARRADGREALDGNGTERLSGYGTPRFQSGPVVLAFQFERPKTVKDHPRQLKSGQVVSRCPRRNPAGRLARIIDDDSQVVACTPPGVRADLASTSSSLKRVEPMANRRPELAGHRHQIMSREAEALTALARGHSKPCLGWGCAS